jgi:hypothetical protein
MVEEEAFREEVLPRMASSHSARLLEAFEPLFVGGLQHKTSRKLQRSLRSILSIAVEIRAISLVGVERYECIWPSIGSTFDAGMMETRGAGPRDRNRVVRLPLCPGLQAYSKKGAVVDYQGFGSGARCHTSSTYVIKALVSH